MFISVKLSFCLLFDIQFEMVWLLLPVIFSLIRLFVLKQKTGIQRLSVFITITAAISIPGIRLFKLKITAHKKLTEKGSQMTRSKPQTLKLNNKRTLKTNFSNIYRLRWTQWLRFFYFYLFSSWQLSRTL